MAIGQPRYPPPRATYVLIALMAAAFVASLAIGGAGGSTDPDVLYRLGAQSAERVWLGEWWRLLTSIFLHAGPVHLLFNGFSLYALGQALEPALGSPRFLVLFFVSGVAASLATLVFVTDVLSVGASGAVFGLAGLLLADELARRRLYRRLQAPAGRVRRRASIIPILALNLALGAIVPQINNYAHVGGLVAGFLLGTAWIESNLRKPARAAAAYLALAALVTILAAVGFRPAYTWVPPFLEGMRASRAGEWDRAREALTRAIESGAGGRYEVYAERAFVEAQAGRYREALADVSRALELSPGNGPLLHLRAAIHVQLGDAAAAVEDAKAACAAGVEEACRALPR